MSTSVYTLGKKAFDFRTRSYVMGIINVTPDSFSDGGKHFDVNEAVEHGLALVEEGADLLDVGGESTRPRGRVYGNGAAPVPTEEEIRRVVPVIERLAQQTDVPVSVDTWKSDVAKEALRAGAVMVNDISGFHFDEKLPGVVAKAGGSAVLMHTPARPWEMPETVVYGDLKGEITINLAEGIERGKVAGVRQMFVDPGFGFGKNVEENFEILASLGFLSSLGYPILVGMSRKAFLGKKLDLPIEDRLESSLAAAVVAVLHGAAILRVHDVRETRRACAVADAVVAEKRKK